MTQARPPAGGERAFTRAVLVYSPLWMAVVAWAMCSGTLAGWRDGAHLALGIGLALPVLALPLLGPALGDDAALPLGGRYATRAVVYLGVTTFIQMWIGSLLFFDRLGMEYHFHVTWTLNRSPVFLYPMTLAYFATYYVLMLLVVRRLGLDRGGPRALLGLALLAYAVAFAETAVMAAPVLRAYFFYRDKTFMLAYGSICYGTVFVCTLPGFLRLAAPRTLTRVTIDAVLANGLALALYAVYWVVLPLMH